MMHHQSQVNVVREMLIRLLEQVFYIIINLETHQTLTPDFQRRQYMTPL